MSILLVTKAAAFAGQAHVWQKRKASNEPYINHLLRVGHQASEAGMTPEVIAAAYLHDTVEDTSVTLEDIRKEFPERVVELVRLLTKWWPDETPPEQKKSFKVKYYAQILGDADAIELKLVDRGDNLRDMARMAHQTRAWSQEFLTKTELEVTQIFHRSVNPKVKTFYQDSLQILRDALKN
jgi:(p)ppGpp synthase/HD superfamily hydrolase